MHFRLLKMIATSGFLAALECSNFVVGPAAWDAYSAAPDPLAVLRREPAFKGMGDASI